MTIANIEVIVLKILESGHYTQMECDAMHSTIERAKKTATIYIPGQWNTVIQSARAAAPYVVVPLNHEDVWDFKKLATSRLRNTKTDFKGDKVNWLAIKWLRYLKDDEGTWHFKYRMHEDLKQLKIKGSSRRGQRLPPPFTDERPRRYDHKIPISEKKKKDLLNLCHLEVVPEEYHFYHQSLHTDRSVRECLPESDEEDEETTHRR